MPKYHYAVLTRALPGQAEEFRAWYDNQHVPDCLKIPGVVSATRYNVLYEVGPSSEGSKELPAPADSLSLYEFEAEDPMALARKLSELAGTDAMPMTDTIDASGTVKYMVMKAEAKS